MPTRRNVTFQEYLLRRIPEYDAEILRDMTPTQMGWVGHVRIGIECDDTRFFFNDGLGRGLWLHFLPSRITPPRLGHGQWMRHLSDRRPRPNIWPSLDHTLDRLCKIWPDL